MCADVAVKDVLVAKRLVAETALVDIVATVEVHVHPDVVPAGVHLVADQADVFCGRLALLVHHKLLLSFTGSGWTRQVEWQAPCERVAGCLLLLHLHALARAALDHQVVLLLLHHILTLVSQSRALPTTVGCENVQPEFFCTRELIRTKRADDGIGPGGDWHGHGHLPVPADGSLLQEHLVPLAAVGVGRLCQDAHDGGAGASATCESLPLVDRW